MRVGLGCMRIGAERFGEVVRAALDAGISLFDTARAYGESERLLGAAIRDRSVRIITKCGMGEGWVPDGRARTILEHARTSHAELGRVPDLLLLHAPDPRTSITTSVRALVEATREGHARAIGLSNVTLRELDEASAVADIAAVEIALGGYDDAAARNGLLAACRERGIEVFAYGVFGGPKRAARLLKDRVLADLARAHDTTPARVMLAYVRAVCPIITPIVGATRVETVKDLEDIELDDGALRRLDERFPGLGRTRVPPPRPTATSREVVMVMGLAGAGKSRLAATLGGTRLNRDAMGGTLKGVARALRDRLAAGDERVVVDNTYLGRAVRADVIATAHENGARVRCVFLDTPPHEVQINVVLRMLERHGRLLGPDELAAAVKTDPNMLAPTAVFRMMKELERPTLDEGFAEIDVVPFHRAPWPAERAGVVIALEAIDQAPQDDAPKLIVGWREGFDGDTRDIAARVAGDVEVAICPHPGGPPRCWCRPPLPGFVIEWAVRRRIDLLRSRVIGNATMARALGLQSVEGSSTKR